MDLKENIENCIKKLRSKALNFQKRVSQHSMSVGNTISKKVRSESLRKIKRINKTIKLRRAHGGCLGIRSR
jgi:hypothetical protein